MKSNLEDSSAQASKKMMHHDNLSMQHQPLPFPPAKQSISKTPSPHFMAPTFSSNQSTAKDTTKSRSEAPNSGKATKAGEGNSFLRTAAKRVGLRRVADGTPRSKKEGMKGISFPDKFATPSYVQLPESPPSSGMQAKNTSPLDKPLPSPPIAQIDTNSPIRVSASLIDASEKPLRRSPAGMVGQEDWPVLHPQRPSNSGTLQELLRETGSQLREQATQGERFPKLGDISRQNSDGDQLPISRYSTHYQLPHKEVSTPNLRTSADMSFHHQSDLADPFHDNAHISEPAASARLFTKSPSNLSASAVAVEKSAQESTNINEPRQTRTSSLRARLSAGQLVKDGQTKVLGFTDFTAPEVSKEPGRRDSLRARKAAQAHSTASSIVSAAPDTIHLRSKASGESVRSSVRPKASRESIGINRGPAKFVAGSRRPAPPRRPGSRGSTRGDSRALSPSTFNHPPSRSAPPVPPSKTLASAIITETANQDGQPRKSSIPVPKNNTSIIESIPTQVGKSGEGDKSLKQVKVLSRDTFNIFEDHTSVDVTQPLDNEAVGTSVEPHHAKGGIELKETQPLESIQESPPHAYHIKRLSMKSPEYGPTLTISPSAERYIMGPDANKENVPPPNSKELVRSLKKNTMHHGNGPAKTATASTARLERPLSSQGLPSPRIGMIDSKAREKKVRSADFGSSHQPAIAQTSKHESSKPYLTIPASSSNDPFYDASEDLNRQSDISKTPEPAYMNGRSDNSIAQDEGWISPLSQTPKNPSGDTECVNADFIPAAIKEHINKQSNTDIMQSVQHEMLEHQTDQTKDLAKTSKNQDHRNASPLTPSHSLPKSGSSPGSYPPRSSSRMAHPNYTAPKSSPATHLTAVNSPPTPSKDFNRRQNNLGSERGYASSQVDLTNREQNRGSNHKRDSAARDSYRSQSSLSKGVLSNFRGLFHKRSSETSDSHKTSKKPSKQKISITSTGSPFPPITEVHPVHRPTLSSRNRSLATANTRTTTTPLQPNTPTIASPTTPHPTEISTTTTLAMQILESARKEHSSPKKERLLELGKIMVDAITQARDAEKAVEEAKQAARRAEMAAVVCTRTLGEIARCVEGFRAEVL